MQLSILLLIAAHSAAGTVNAAAPPEFTSCLVPTGDIKANYESGIHGVPGDPATYSGKDVVYRLSSQALTQCLCPENGQGIQTDWWKASEISDNEISSLKAQGWIYVPNGAAWGLDDAPYLAKNSGYVCKGSSNSGTSAQSGQGGTDGMVSSASVEKLLGLASTGNMQFLLSVAIVGFLTLTAGLIARKRNL